jgi:cytochrome c551/c552
VAVEALFCGPSTSSINQQFRGKSTNSLKLSKNLALNESIFKKCGP